MKGGRQRKKERKRERKEREQDRSKEGICNEGDTQGKSIKEE